jgi:hypothetical protein
MQPTMHGAAIIAAHDMPWHLLLQVQHPWTTNIAGALSQYKQYPCTYNNCLLLN